MSDPVLYAERGASWWPVLWGPGFALVGILVESLTPGARHTALWLLLAGILAVATGVWVYGRRRLCSVRLTRTTLSTGREDLEVSRIASLSDVGVPVGARVLGGSWTVPRGTSEVPLGLDDGTVVVAWAKNPEGLTEALGRVVRK